MGSATSITKISSVARFRAASKISDDLQEVGKSDNNGKSPPAWDDGTGIISVGTSASKIRADVTPAAHKEEEISRSRGATLVSDDLRVPPPTRDNGTNRIIVGTRARSIRSGVTPAALKEKVTHDTAPDIRAKLFITTLDGVAVTTVSFQPADTVDQVCALIREATQIPVQRQKLLFAGQELQHDGLTIEEHGVLAESTLQLITLGKSGPLDALFDEADAPVMRGVGGFVPGKRTHAMYFGGAFGPTDGRLYLVPCASARAARFDPRTKTWEAFGDTFRGDSKWIGAAVSSFDNCIYSFPAECSVVSHVLQINPALGTASKVGRSVLELADGVRDYPWHGAIAAADGCIYGIPNNAPSVLRFDPRTEKLKKFGKLQIGKRKYKSAVLGPTGRFIFCIPARADQVLSIDTVNLTCELIGEHFGRSKHIKWFGGAIGGDNSIYCIPLERTNHVLRIDPLTKTTSLFGSALLSGSWAWTGGATGADGCVYGTPHHSERVLRIDPFAGTVSTVGDPISVELQAKLHQAVLGPDGALWCLPYHLPCRILRLETPNPARYTPLLTQLLQPAQHEALCEALTDHVYHGPALAAALHWEATRPGGDDELVNRLIEATAPALPGCVLSEKDGHTRMSALLLQALASSMPRPEVVAVGESVPGPTGEWIYQDGAFGPDGRLYIIPRNAERAIRFDPKDGTWEAFGDTFTEGGAKWVGAAVSSFDNCIYSFPCECSVVSHVLQINPALGTARTLDTRSVLKLANGISRAWHGAVATADGCCYGIPLRGTSVLRFDPRTQELSTFGHLDNAAGRQYFSGILGPAGRFIFCIPADAERVLCIDTVTLTCELIGDEFNMPMKWSGGGLGSDGAIYCIPLAHDRILRIDPLAKTTSLFGPSLRSGDFAWSGGTVGADGCIYGTPNKCDHVLRIDPLAGTVSTVGAAIPSEVQSTLAWAVLGPNKNIWCLPAHLPSRLLKITPPSNLPPLEPLRSLVRNPLAFQQCVYLDMLRDDFVPICIRHARLYQQSASKTKPHMNGPPLNGLPVVQHLQKQRPGMLAALQTIRALPLPVAMEFGTDFVSHFAVSSALRLAPAPKAWQPLPTSSYSWSWPPPPLVPLRAACRIAQAGGPEGVEAAWPALSQSIATLLVTMVDAVRADLSRARTLLVEVFDQERRRALEIYRKQLRRTRRDPTYPEFKAVAKRLLTQCAEHDRKKERVQTISFFPWLYAAAYQLQPRFDAFIKELSRRCAGSTALYAPLKGCGRALEKLVLRADVPSKFKSKGAKAVDARHIVDVLRGSLKCPDFTEITFVLELLMLLDVDMGDSFKAQAAGFDLSKFQIRLIHIKNRFTTPTTGGWADCLVNFRFAHGDGTQHVMELQLQHEQMLVVRKEGKAHKHYNSFRSAFELLETVGEAPNNSFQETEDDQSPLEVLQLHIKKMQSQLDVTNIKLSKYEEENKSLSSKVQADRQSLLSSVAAEKQSLLSKVSMCEAKNKMLVSRFDKYETETQNLLSRVDKYETENRRLISQVDSYKTERKRLLFRASSSEEENQRLISKVNGYEAENQRLRSRVDKYEAENQSVISKFKTENRILHPQLAKYGAKSPSSLSSVDGTETESRTLLSNAVEESENESKIDVGTTNNPYVPKVGDGEDLHTSSTSRRYQRYTHAKFSFNY